jgi:hypothetical protein
MPVICPKCHNTINQGETAKINKDNRPIHPNCDFRDDVFGNKKLSTRRRN